MNPRFFCVTLVALTLCLCSAQAPAQSVLRIAAFNLYNPGNHPDATYERWGRELGARADVLLLSEVGSGVHVLRHAKLLADAAGMRHVEVFSDLAIVSRTPLYGVAKRLVKPDSPFPLSDGHNSSILSAKTDIDGTPHQFIANHWGVRDVNRPNAGPDWSSPTRLKAARQVIALSDRSMPVFVGGDLNAYSGVGPQRVAGSTNEVSELRTRFTDVFIQLQLGNAAHCSDQRIDYLMFSGRSYIPISYDACSNAAPSDHPIVLAEFRKELQPIPREGQTVACAVFNDGSAQATSRSDAIYFPGNQQACIPDNSARGACRRWFGDCVAAGDNAKVRFTVFNDGGSRASAPSDALYNAGPTSECVPDGTATGTCRKWFGSAATARSEVDCYLFDDGHSNWIGPTNALFYRGPGEVCMPNGASGECRKWFGNCRVTNRSVQDLPHDPMPSPAHQKCSKACTLQRDRCMADVDMPGGSTPKLCVAELRQCQADCPP